MENKVNWEGYFPIPNERNHERLNHFIWNCYYMDIDDKYFFAKLISYLPNHVLTYAGFPSGDEYEKINGGGDPQLIWLKIDESIDGFGVPFKLPKYTEFVKGIKYYSFEDWIAYTNGDKNCCYDFEEINSESINYILSKLKDYYGEES